MSIYVLAVNGLVQKYPYSLTDMRLDNPSVSFTADISDDIAAAFNTFPVDETSAPTFNQDTEELVWINPIFVNGRWVQQWRVDLLSPQVIADRLEYWRQTASCTPFQGRMALINASLMEQVQSAIDAADETTKTAWEYALEWKRNSPMISSLAATLGMTDEQIDGLFRAAMLIVV